MMRLLQASSGTKLFIHLIEPNPLLRQLILKRLKTEPRIRVLGQRRIDDLLSATGQQVTVLIDRAAMGYRFMPILQNIVSSTPQCRVAILDNDDIAVSELCSLISTGVHGFLSFTHLDKQLIPAILALNREELWFSRSVIDYYVRGVNSLLLKRRAGGKEALTFRQEQIKALARKGLSNKEISATLNISESTVKFHLRKIFVKLGVQDRRSLILQTKSNAAVTD
jgi:DNA-binding NarL/FixJ family response regulator